MHTSSGYERTLQIDKTLCRRLVPLLAIACGLIAANIYYAQPLIGPISDSLDMPAQFAGLVALAAPLAGYAGDHGWDRPATGAAMAAVAACFALGQSGSCARHLGLARLVLAAISLGFGVSMHAVLGQRAILALGPELRSRLNGLFMAAYFTAGALGSILGAWTYAHGGWNLVNRIGLSLPLLAIICFYTEPYHVEPR